MSEAENRVAWDMQLAGLQQSGQFTSLANLGAGNLAVNGSLKIRSKPKRLKPRGTWKKLRRCKCR